MIELTALFPFSLIQIVLPAGGTMLLPVRPVWLRYLRGLRFGALPKYWREAKGDGGWHLSEVTG